MTFNWRRAAAYTGISLAILVAPPGSAQDLLPQGVGLYQYGYRSYAQQIETYDGSGAKVPLANKFAKPLDGPNLLGGKGGADLQRLAEELKKFDGAGAGDKSLLGQLDLGRIEGDVEANVSAQVFALGFGITDQLTFFLGVPLIEAEVNASLSYAGTNNALAIRDALGDVAFDELKDGLVQASQISETQVKNSIVEAGYEPLGAWSHKGIGDIRLGTKSAWRQRLGRSVGYHLGLTLQVDLPTGYVENPDILTDVNLGRGYYSLGARFDQSLLLLRRFFIGIDFSYNENLEATLEKRVPIANENLVTADRKTQVSIRPGDDMDVGTSVGWSGDIFSASWRGGAKRHFSDVYAGSLEGNYDKLGSGSSSYQAYHELKLAVSTTNAYKRGFPVPFILSALAHHPLQGRNVSDERYYELSLASFFSTPLAADDKPRKMGKRGKRGRTAMSRQGRSRGLARAK